jgi:type IV pilus assembly protein PilV
MEMNSTMLKTYKPSFSTQPYSTQQRGATLIEAMVSLFVFAVGALGIAAIQTTSLVRVDDTKQRSLAIWKAQELADRMRYSKTIDDPDGLIPEYIAEINNTNTDSGIGVVSSSDVFTCPTTPPTRCDDVDGTAVVACDVDELVEFDIWSIMCDPSTGISLVGDDIEDGNIGLRDLEIAMEADGTGYRLYFEWQNRSANNDTDLQSDTTTARTVVTNLCGENENIDSRLDVYCLRFE